MMYNSLTINGQHFEKAALLVLANQHLADSKLSEWERDFYSFVKDWLGDSPFIEVTTSGSTGTAKPMQLEKEHMVQSALMTGVYFNLRPEQKALLCLPTTFIAGKMMVVRSFVLKLNLVLVPPDSNPVTELPYPVDFTAMTPMQVQAAFQANGQQQLANMGQLIIGGGTISAPLQSSIESLQNPAFSTFGMTETITHIALKRLNGEKKSDCYQAINGVSFSVDSRNCLVISAPHVGQPSLVTNDVVELVDEQQFVWKGRYDNVINTGGVKVSPEQVEQLLAPIIPQRFFVIGSADPVLGEAVTLVLEGTRPDDASLQLLKVRVVAATTKFHRPRLIGFADAFEETPTGKIRRKDTLNVSKIIRW